MKFFKKLAIATALTSLSLAASAMTPIADTELSQVSGQDGVSIAANLNVNIGSFQYSTNNNAAGTGGGEVSFNNVAITGTFAATLDILNNSKFFQSTGATTLPTGEAMTVLGLDAVKTQAADLAGFYPLTAAGTGTDVVKIAIPKIYATAGNQLNVTVGSITMGSNGVANSANASFGSFALNNIQMQGTTVYIWAH